MILRWIQPCIMMYQGACISDDAYYIIGCAWARYAHFTIPFLVVLLLSQVHLFGSRGLDSARDDERRTMIHIGRCSRVGVIVSSHLLCRWTSSEENMVHSQLQPTTDKTQTAPDTKPTKTQHRHHVDSRRPICSPTAPEHFKARAHPLTCSNVFLF